MSLKGVNPVCNASDFTAFDGGPGYYTPFDDSTEGWTHARNFSKWVHLNHDNTLPRLASFNASNMYARKHWDVFVAWYARLILKGGKP